MTTFQISASDRGHAHTEAAIYAEGTTWTADELYGEYMAACEKAGERISPQRVFAEVLAASKAMTTNENGTFRTE